MQLALVKVKRGVVVAPVSILISPEGLMQPQVGPLAVRAAPVSILISPEGLMQHRADNDPGADSGFQSSSAPKG